MATREDLEAGIRETAAMLQAYETIVRESSDPKEQARARRVIAEQTPILADYLTRYGRLCQTMGYAVPLDIAEVAAMQSVDLQASPTAPAATPVPPPPTPSPAARRRLQMKQHTLQQQYEALMERLNFLKTEQATQSDPSMRFTLQQQIAQVQQQCDGLEQQLDALEQQIGGEEPPP